MANHLIVPDTPNHHITWRQGVTIDKKGALDFTLRDTQGNPIAKAKLTAEQLHAYICMHNTMK